MPSTAQILLGLALPAVLAALILALGWRTSRNAAGAIAVGVAFCVGFIGFFGRPRLPVANSMDWLCYLALAAAVWGVLDAALFSERHMTGALAFLILAALALWLTLSPIPQSQWWMRGSVVAALVLWLLLKPLTQTDATLPLALLITSLAAGAVLLSENSLALGDLGGVLSAAMAGCTVVVLITGSLGRGALGVWVVLLVTLLACGHVMADVLPVHIAILAVAPLGAWIIRAPGVRKLPPWLRTALALLVVAGIVAIVSIPAIRELIQMRDEA